MSYLEQYYAGTTIRIDVEVKNYAGTLIDPGSIVISIIDPANEIKIDEAAMQKDATGQYYYNVQTAEDWVLGDYLVKPKAESAGYTALVKPYLFTLIG